MSEFDSFQVAQASPSRPDYRPHSTSSRPDGELFSPSRGNGAAPPTYTGTRVCPAGVEMNRTADFHLNQKIDAPAALSQSEQASAKALAELAQDFKRGFAEMKARPLYNTDFSIEDRQETDKRNMADLLKNKTHEEMDRVIAAADQLLGGTSLKLARADDHVWLGDKDYPNQAVDPANRRYGAGTLILGLTPADVCPRQFGPYAPPAAAPRTTNPPLRPSNFNYSNG